MCCVSAPFFIHALPDCACRKQVPALLAARQEAVTFQMDTSTTNEHTQSFEERVSEGQEVVTPPRTYNSACFKLGGPPASGRWPSMLGPSAAGAKLPAQLRPPARAAGCARTNLQSSTFLNAAEITGLVYDTPFRVDFTYTVTFSGTVHVVFATGARVLCRVVLCCATLR